jgi:pimeloyl-ACP methyl ester carboxylesterase
MDATLRNAAGERLDFAFHPGARHDALVVLGHGLSANKDRPLLVHLAEELSRCGYPCLRLSFAGNGDSQGRFEHATISKEADDLTAVLDQLKGPRRIAYVGHSMGAAVGTLVAARDERIDLLVSLAGMVRAREFYQREFCSLEPGRAVMWDDAQLPLSQAFKDDLLALGDTLAAAREVRAPWLFVHGDADDLVPLEDTDAAFAVAREPKHRVIIRGGDHSFEHCREAVAAAVVAWLKLNSF